MVFSPSLSLKSAIISVTSCDTVARRASIQSSANFSWLSSSPSSQRLSQPFTSFMAFHILLLKLRPCSICDSSNNRSLPAGDDIITLKRTTSAPESSIICSRSGELPSDLLIFRPCLSRTIPVKYTLSKGFLPMNSYPAMIIRATQKKMISGAVTSVLVG